MSPREDIDLNALLGAAHGAILVDGDWVATANGTTFPAIDPGTGETIGNVAAGDAAEELPPAFIRSAARSTSDVLPACRRRSAFPGPFSATVRLLPISPPGPAESRKCRALS